MKISSTGEFAGSADSVFAVIADESFQQAKVAATSGEGSASVAQHGDRTLIETTRIVPTDGLPDVAKSFVGAALTLHETQDWGPAGADGGRVGTIALRADNAPVAMNGTITLVAHGAAATLTVEADLKASVPLVGGRIEKAAAPAITDGIAHEQQLIRDRL